MLIRTSEKPLISMKNGKMLGTLKGLILHQNKLSFLYCKIEERFTYIPVEDAVLNQDAVLLKKDCIDTLFSTSSETPVYSQDGKKLGVVNGIEFDDDFHMTAIKMREILIKKDNIISIDNIIVVNITEDQLQAKVSTEALQEKHQLGYINDELALPKNNIAVESQNPPEDTPPLRELQEDISEEEQHISQENNNAIEEKKDFSEETAVEITEEVSQEADLETVPTEDDNETINTAVKVAPTDDNDTTIDPRYHYLLGRKLVENVEIDGNFYLAGTAINADLVQLAMDHNAIVKIIMNAED